MLDLNPLKLLDYVNTVIGGKGAVVKGNNNNITMIFNVIAGTSSCTCINSGSQSS